MSLNFAGTKLCPLYTWLAFGTLRFSVTPTNGESLQELRAIRTDTVSLREATRQRHLALISVSG